MSNIIVFFSIVQRLEFHPKDISRVNNTNDWLRRFLIHHDLDIKDALSMLWDTCEWRKTNKVNEINEQNVNIEYLSEGSLFVHGRDKDGKSLFIFKCKKHVKGQKDFEELKKCVIYWFERVERQDKGNQITIFFDMADTGLANMDMEYTKYLINLCKLYYPHFLNYIIIFEMPWVLNAAFKIIKSWLPSKAVQKIKFVNRVSLKDYVEADQALKCWGGTDDYEFSFQPEPALSDGKVEENKKKVHFADGSPLSDNSPSSFGDSKQEEPCKSSKVKISPVDAIVFAQEGIEVLGNLSITNTSDSFISYKVKTTSPEKFRVRPSCGILAQGHTVNINVVVQPGYTGSNILRDKFLIMTFVIDHEGYSTNELNDLWKVNKNK
ncbi:hypothetical protein AAG570_012093 [Ranatra chinensis]|uniref:Motile sperm domain-containing protein 2 n=1 Tax=Ranatra chinensis TaxID=642074 RepID=A0ABD0YWA0_9HEMI